MDRRGQPGGVVNCGKDGVQLAGTPLEKAKSVAISQARSDKDAHWLGVRMENFSRALGQLITGATLEDVCRYLDGLLNHEFKEWQVKQAVDAIGGWPRLGQPGCAAQETRS